MINISIVHHTHWDREWFFSTQDSLVLSDLIFSEILEELKNNPDLKFVLDGQISIVDDYIELYPEKMDLIRELVSNNQLFLGPWFTQFDAIIPHEESMFRNAMIGDIETSKYGKK
ncbi:glycoside hydrolase family 38 N-terminal domain-containing protein [Helcococcus kunzii]